MARTQSGNKIVVTLDEVDSLFPARREDIDREIIIDGRKEPFHIRGGAYSPNLEILGNGKIRGAIFASETVRAEISVNNDHSDLNAQYYLSGISAKKSISLNSAKSKIGDNYKYIIRGDVLAGDRVSLTDACVIGSVQAPNVYLKNSAVFGTINADYNLESVCSLIGMYRTNTITFKGPNTISVAGGMSSSPPECKNLTKPSPFKFGLRFLPACRTEKTGCQMNLSGLSEEKFQEMGKDVEDLIQIEQSGTGLICMSWLENNCPFADNIRLGKLDFYQISRRLLEKAEDGRKTGNISDSDEEVWILGVQGRALAFKNLKEQNDEFFRILRGIFAYEHISSEQKEAEQERWEDFLSEQEQELFMSIVEAFDY